LLKVGGLPTVELLRLCKWSSEIEIKIFGVTNFKKFGWATAQDIPTLKSVGEAILFLSNENEIGLIEFEGAMTNFCLVKTYQDSECSLSFSGRSESADMLKKIVPSDHCNYFVNFFLAARLRCSFGLRAFSTAQSFIYAFHRNPIEAMTASD
jgi:hypothetical protein